MLVKCHLVLLIITCDVACFKIKHGFIFWAPEADTSWLRSLEQQVLDRLRKAQDLSTLSCFNTILWCLNWTILKHHEIPKFGGFEKYFWWFLIHWYLLAARTRICFPPWSAACTRPWGQPVRSWRLQGDAVDGSKISRYAGQGSRWVCKAWFVGSNIAPFCSARTWRSNCS